MPMGKHVRIVIAIDGACSIDAINFTGPSCRVITLEIARILGDNVSRQQDKPEMRTREGTRLEQREAGR